MHKVLSIQCPAYFLERLLNSSHTHTQVPALLFPICLLEHDLISAQKRWSVSGKKSLHIGTGDRDIYNKSFFFFF